VIERRGEFERRGHRQLHRQGHARHHDRDT
jgi:hypothetical protein